MCIIVSSPPRYRRRTCSNLIHREPFHPLPPRKRGMSKAPPPVHPTWAGVVKARVRHHLLLHLAPPLQLPASFSCTRIAWQGGYGLDCVLRLQEERRSSASYAEKEEQLHQQQPKDPQRSRDAQLTRGEGTGKEEKKGLGGKKERASSRRSSSSQLSNRSRQPYRSSSCQLE
jgi:hypothetical protein